MRGHSFNNVKPNRPRRSVFNLNHKKLMTGEMGYLYPSFCQSMVPGDTFKIANRFVIRMAPLVGPIMTDIKVFFHYFFAPYRILWDDWNDFITGGVDGDFATPVPRWEPSSSGNDLGTLWDYMGFPIDVDPDGAYPLDFPRRAYVEIYNTYYRDENIIDELDYDIANVKKRAWRKDYFTSALPWQQRGTAPAFPVSGTTTAVFPLSSFPDGNPPSAAINLQASGTVSTPGIYVNDTVGSEGSDNVKAALDDNVVDLSSATTFDISDLRLGVQLQRWRELNARAGVRYPEYLFAHYGQDIGDHTVQRPVYIGGMSSDLIISEVLQTSESGTTALGTLGGHGITVNDGYIGSYHAKEFGLVMGIMSIMPEAMYQEGIDRQWLYEDNTEFFNPAFVNLSEQDIKQAELVATDVDSENNTIFGYQEMNGEMRFAKSLVVGKMRSGVSGSLEHMHLARDFGGTPPTLNQGFLECTPDNRIFAVPSEPGFMIEIGNICEAIRPIPLFAQPGFMDH